MVEGTELQRSAGFWLRIAIACGALPLLTGVITLLVFLQSDVSSSEMLVWAQVGMFILMGGLFLFFVGLVTLWAYLMKGGRSGVPKRDLAQNVLLTIILLLANFPAALACIWIAGDTFNRAHLSLVNESSVAVEDLNITWPGGSQRIEELGPGGRAELSFHIGGEGAVEFTSSQAGESCEGTLSGYVTPNMRVSIEVMFSDGCEVAVIER